ncbi:MAG: ATPase domain-containing protein [Candidatus Lokiarchaeia archaeon]
MKLITSGISELDTLLGGGFNRRAPILFLSETGSMAEILALQILSSRMSRGDFSFILDLDIPPARIREWFNWFNWNYEKYEEKDYFLLIDGFTKMFGDIESNEKNILREPRDVVKVDSFLIRLIPQIERFKNKVFSVFFFSNIFLAKAETPKIINLIYKQSMNISQYGAAIYVFDKGMLDTKTQNTLEHAFDFVIDFKIEEHEGRFQRYLRVKKSPQPRHIDEYAPYEITPEKIVVRTGLVEDFETFKQQLKMVKKGYINLLNNRVILLGADYLSWLFRGLINTFGYEKIQNLLYSLSKKRGSSFFFPFVKEFKPSDLGDALNYYVKFINLRGEGELKLVDFDPEEESFKLRIYDNPVCSYLKDLGKPAGAVMAGVATGTIEKYTGKEYECEEVKCLATGDEYCEFDVKPVKKKRDLQNFL